MILFRPVGLGELLLIYRTSLKRFPARRAEQPIFYPVLNEAYATHIARVWNTKNELLAGYVTEFDVDDGYARSLPIRQVGASEHRELWIAAESLDDFNDHIRGRIRVIGAHFAATFVGMIPNAYSLKAKNAREQVEVLWGIYKYSLMDFHGEVTANNEAVFVHYPYWEQLVTAGAVPMMDGPSLLQAIQEVWSRAYPDVPLGVQPSECSVQANVL